VDAAASDAFRTLGLIQALELPLALALNRSRVMTVTQGCRRLQAFRTSVYFDAHGTHAP